MVVYLSLIICIWVSVNIGVSQKFRRCIIPTSCGQKSFPGNLNLLDYQLIFRSKISWAFSLSRIDSQPPTKTPLRSATRIPCQAEFQEPRRRNTTVEVMAEVVKGLGIRSCIWIFLVNIWWTIKTYICTLGRLWYVKRYVNFEWRTSIVLGFVEESSIWIIICWSMFDFSCANRCLLCTMGSTMPNWRNILGDYTFWKDESNVFAANSSTSRHICELEPRPKQNI